LILPPATRALDDRARPQDFEEAGALALSRLRQSAVPVSQEESQFISESE